MFDRLRVALTALCAPKGQWHVHRCATCGDPIICGDTSDLGGKRYCVPCERVWLETQARSLATMLAESIAYGGKYGKPQNQIVH